MAVKRLLLGVLLCVVAWIGLVTANSEVAASAPAPAPASLADDPIHTAWEKGPHGHTYDIGKGPNTYCSRCHSPRNWDPASKIDAAPNCVSCKFSFDKAPRVARGNPPVAEPDWKSIGCDVCHRSQGSSVDSRLAWWNVATSSYETIHNATALCSKCHTDTETIRHRRDLGVATHVGFGCTSCHDAHSTEASCSTVSCHPGLNQPGKSIPGHDAAHHAVSCGACHDASGMTVGPDESGKWVNLRTTELMGRSTTKEYQSHNLQRIVNCERCHSPSNSWGLRAISGSGPSAGQKAATGGTAPGGHPPGSAPASPGKLTLVLARPGEGETFYAGPPVLMHSVPVSGSVEAQGEESSGVELRLEVLRDGKQVAQQVAHPLADGSFSFDVTVNPDASVGQFPPEKASCEICHKQGEIDLPSGASTIRITAAAPSGKQVIAERHVLVDRAGFATVPAKVVLAEDPLRPVSGVPVSGASRLFDWRTRIGAATSDREGLARVHVEVLATAPTHYVFQVEPSVVDRVMYESLEPVRLDLAAGATEGAPITIKVRRRLGTIAGALKEPNGKLKHPITVSAILLPEGQSYRTETTSSGDFSFSSLPVGEYLLAVDRDALRIMGLDGAVEAVDLSATGSASVILSPGTSDPRIWRGSVRDIAGRPIPFAQVGPDGAIQAVLADPMSGAFSLSGLATSVRTTVATAPGYYSQAQLLPPAEAELQYNLVRRPETRSVPWGTGEVILPPESEAVVAPGRISLERGSIWGYGDGEVISLVTAQGTIRLESGSFALEAAPGGAPLLLVKEGRAVVSPRGNGEPVEVRGGQLLVLTADRPFKPVGADPETISVLRHDSNAWIQPAWEPTVQAQVRDRLAGMGIGAVQITTLVTYIAVSLSIVLLPLLVIGWLWRRRAMSPRADSGGI